MATQLYVYPGMTKAHKEKWLSCHTTAINPKGKRPDPNCSKHENAFRQAQLDKELAFRKKELKEKLEKLDMGMMFGEVYFEKGKPTELDPESLEASQRRKLVLYLEQGRLVPAKAEAPAAKGK